VFIFYWQVYFLLEVQKEKKETLNILALDLGTKMGWALYTDDNIYSCVEDFSLKVKEKNRQGKRFEKLEVFLNLMHQKYNINHVFFEKVMQHHKSRAAAAIYNGFWAILITWCEKNNIMYEGVSVGTIKRFIAGKGNASKEEVINSVKNKGFSDIIDDNEADALALLLYAIGSVKI
jgi:Holliday junction resolvasome RuvABC endonuclease subunit